MAGLEVVFELSTAYRAFSFYHVLALTVVGLALGSMTKPFMLWILFPTYSVTLDVTWPNIIVEAQSRGTDL